jgi:hypothetical protein
MLKKANVWIHIWDYMAKALSRDAERPRKDPGKTRDGLRKNPRASRGKPEKKEKPAKRGNFKAIPTESRPGSEKSDESRGETGRQSDERERPSRRGSFYPESDASRGGLPKKRAPLPEKTPTTRLTRDKEKGIAAK